MDHVEFNPAPESLQNDAVLAPLQEIEEDAIPSIEEAFDETAAQVEETPEDVSATTEEVHVTKPQSMKVRMEAYETRGYKRGKEEAEKAFAQERQQFESRLAKLVEYELREEAAKLAKDEGISESIAMRLLRAERGIPTAKDEATPAANEQPRDAAGRFVSAKPKADERGDALLREARLIEEAMGISVSELLDSASEADKQALVSGNMGMAEFVRKNVNRGKRTPSVTTRNATGNAGRSFENMGDAQWEAFNAELARGRKYSSK